MGSAILKGYKVGGGHMSYISILDPYMKPEVAAELNINALYRNHSEIPKGLKFSTVVFATKPQVFKDASRFVANILAENTLIISIMAGVSCQQITQCIGRNMPVVRCMPNMAAAVQLSVNVAYTTDVAYKFEFENLFRGSGPVRWINGEEDIHATTAISGSGPAYFFAFIEALSNAGVKSGLDPMFALDLSIDTFIGASELMKQGRTPKKLRESVTSKGGTTAAGLNQFTENDSLNKLVMKVVAAAKQRSIEL